MLKYLEKMGILHREIKLTNLMTDNEGKARFIDWGSSCFRYGVKKDSLSIPSNSSNILSVFMTPLWSLIF
jgi:serine/threonine protein kinase